MKKILIALFVFATMTNCSSQSNCKIDGYWKIKSGRFSKNYEMSRPFSSNSVLFLDGTVELASGFFYSTDSLIDDYPAGRHPFVYYGNNESYEVKGDSLRIFNSAFNDWTSFKIVCFQNDQIRLDGKISSLDLIRSKPSEGRSWTIKRVKAHLNTGGGSADLSKMNYVAEYLNTDSLVFSQFDMQGKKIEERHFPLKIGTFSSIERGFKGIDLLNIKNVYPSKISEFTTVDVEIELLDGRLVRTKLQGEDYPDEIRLAMIPVLYGHQRLLYSHLVPIK